MIININENSENRPIATKSAGQQPSAESLRRAAVQFEALLLNQLTSSLNATSNDDDEDNLFGNDGGSNLAKQMFSEQLATTMANSGGIGMSDLILQQFRLDTRKLESNAGKLTVSVSEIRKPGTAEAPVAPAINAESAVSNRATVDNTAIAAPDFPSASGENMRYKTPVFGRISSDYGNRFHPIDKKTKFHPGLDIAAPLGTPIRAAGEGVVTFAGWSKGYGNLVIIKHPDGRETRYGHSSKLLVNEGEAVSAGQQIALVGSTGKSTGPHLHFEVREDGKPVNPEKFLSNVLPRKTDK